MDELYNTTPTSAGVNLSYHDTDNSKDGHKSFWITLYL